MTGLVGKIIERERAKTKMEEYDLDADGDTPVAAAVGNVAAHHQVIKCEHEGDMARKFVEAIQQESNGPKNERAPRPDAGQQETFGKGKGRGKGRKGKNNKGKGKGRQTWTWTPWQGNQGAGKTKGKGKGKGKGKVTTVDVVGKGPQQDKQQWSETTQSK